MRGGVLLTGADPERGSQAFGTFPPPLRLLIRRVWQLRYATSIWS